MKAYALQDPGIPGERPASAKFGFLPALAKYLLKMQGWREPGIAIPEWVEANPKIATEDEIDAMCEALLSPQIDCWGYKVVSAEYEIAKEFAMIGELEDVEAYYEAPEVEILPADPGDDEYVIREAVSHVTDRGSLHDMLDMLAKMDRDLDAPGLVAQIHKQIDEGDIGE